MNELIRSMANEEGVPIAEIHADFMAQPSLESPLLRPRAPERGGLPAHDPLLVQRHHQPRGRDRLPVRSASSPFGS